MCLLGSGAPGVTDHKPIIGYALVAGACLVTHNIVLIVADAAGFPLMFCMLTSFIIVALFGYVMHSLISFRRPLSLLGLQRYVSAMSASVAIAFMITWICKDGIGLPIITAAPLASGLMLVINFLLSRWAIIASARFSE
jgi:putative flippase GtrA